MAPPRRALTVRASVANMRSSPGPVEAEYALPLDLPAAFRFVVGSTLVDDGRAVIGCSDSSGAWLRVYDADKGADITAADTALSVGDGAWRTIPVGALVLDLPLTLSTTNARPGATIEVTRLDVGSAVVPISNGGIAGGTLVTLPHTARSFALFYFNGINWELRRSGLLL